MARAQLPGHVVAALVVREPGERDGDVVASGCLMQLLMHVGGGIGLLLLMATRAVHNLRAAALMADRDAASKLPVGEFSATPVMLLVATSESAYIFDRATKRGPPIWADQGRLVDIVSAPNSLEDGAGDLLTLHADGRPSIELVVNGLMMPERLAMVRALRRLCATERSSDGSQP